MNDAVLNAAVRPGDLPSKGRFLGKGPALVAGLFATLLIGGIIAGAILRLESDKTVVTDGVPTDSALRASNSLGDFLDEAPAAPVPDAEPEPLAPVSPPLPVVSEQEQAQRDFLLNMRMQELQNRELGRESSAIIQTSSIVRAGSAPQNPPQPQTPADNSQPSGQARLDPALAALAANAGKDNVDGQDKKIAWLKDQDRSSWLPHTREGDLSQLTLKTGAVIPGVLISGLNSDLPGDVIAQVSQNVYDTATGRHLLIPQGAKLYGTYDSRINYGQNRALVVWERIIFPDASTLELGRMQGADMSGALGFEDKVNNHYLRTFGQLFLLSAIQAAPGQISDTGQTSGDNEFAQITAANYSRMGEKLIDRNLSIQPTIRIRPGYSFLVMVNQDILFRTPYRS